MPWSEKSKSVPADAPIARTSAGSYPSYDDVLAEAESLNVLRPSWDDYFLGIAWAVARRADCRRRQIGGVIVDKDRRIASTGYNGAPWGEGSCTAAGCPRGLRRRKAL